jgi:hypothetical protein
MAKTNIGGLELTGMIQAIASTFGGPLFPWHEKGDAGDWGLLIYIGRWRVPEANSKKLEEMFRAMLTHVRSNREKYRQLQSCVICSSGESGSWRPLQ